jgi:hypothetical protein
VRVRGKARLGIVAGGAAAIVGGGGAVVAGVMVLAVFLSSGPDPAPDAVATGGCGTSPAPAVPVLNPGPSIASLDADQTRNARTIVQVAAQVSAAHGLDAGRTRLAAVIGIMTALQESSLHNIGYGDLAGPDSRGLFQQRAAWGPLSERMDPAGAARMFYNGGHGGQRGLFGVPAWWSMPLWAAAQAVQVSAFPTAYAKWQRTAEAVVSALLGSAGSSLPSVQPVAQPSALPSSVGTLNLGPSACQAQPVAATVPAKGWVLPLPAGSFTMTSPYGWRMHPIVHEWRLHTGDDLAAPMGTPVYDVFPGKVIAAGPNDGYGNQIVVQHAGGVASAYNHLSAILVPVGATVNAGQLIGRVGSTGMSTGAHLHFEIRQNGRPIDPAPFMRQRGVELGKPR